jgi:hypothetical protein
MIRAGMHDRDLHFHDLRGTAATNFYRAGFTVREIAQTRAWAENKAERLIDLYVARRDHGRSGAPFGSFTAAAIVKRKQWSLKTSFTEIGPIAAKRLSFPSCIRGFDSLRPLQHLPIF